MEPRGRIRLLIPPRVVRLLATLACVVAAARHASATSFVTPTQALAEAFPGARIEKMSVVMTEVQLEAVRKRAKARITSKIASASLAWRGDTLAGVAFFDARTVRTMPGTFMIVVGPDTTVLRVEVLAFHEPPDYRPPPRWLAMFQKRRLDDRLSPGRDIRNLSGASLSAAAVTESVRQALALYEVVVAPRLGKGADR
jgi:hypothetical protein